MEKPPRKKTLCGWGEKVVSDQGTDKVICLTCKQVNSVLKEFNVKRHYEANHKSYDKFMAKECKQNSFNLAVCIFPLGHSIISWLPKLALKTLRTPDLLLI